MTLSHLSFHHFSVICHGIYFFFFFQAEDGIRDGHVTGVQTCALPICTLSTNPIMFMVATWIVLAWRVAGYWGVDYFILPRLGAPAGPTMDDGSTPARTVPQRQRA